MTSLDRLAKILESANIRKLSSEIGVSAYLLRKIKQRDGNVPYKAIKAVEEYYFGGDKSGDKK